MAKKREASEHSDKKSNERKQLKDTTRRTVKSERLERQREKPKLYFYSFDLVNITK